MLRASRRELERAYRSHRDLAQSDKVRTTQSHHLLLVYSLECGLKASVMRRRNIDDTSMLGEINFGHDPQVLEIFHQAVAPLCPDGEQLVHRECAGLFRRDKYPGDGL